MYSVRDIIEYAVMLIGAFAQKYGMTRQEAQVYFSKYGVFDLIQQHYGAMHTQTFDDMVNDVAIFCKRQGGKV